MPYKLDESDIDCMKAEDFYRRRYQSELSAHPDCKDPEHPGCEFCEDNEESQDD